MEAAAVAVDPAVAAVAVEDVDLAVAVAVVAVGDVDLAITEQYQVC